MRSFQSIAASIAFSALMAAGATCGGAEDAPLGVRLVNQMNGLYGQHPGVRANHAKGAVFEGMFTPAQGADTLSSAVFLKGNPTPLVIRFSNAGGIPDMVEDGVTGLMASCDDPGALADRVLRLSDDTALASRITSRAREECHKYSWVAVRNQWLKLYRELAPANNALSSEPIAESSGRM